MALTRYPGSHVPIGFSVFDVIAGAGDDKIMSIINNLPRVEPKEDDSDCIPVEYRFGNKKQKVR